jgi:hypothetical protein
MAAFVAHRPSSSGGDSMTESEIWDAVLDYTRGIVLEEKFDRIAKSCPYFEGWWEVELAQSFARPGKYGIAGFEPRCVSKPHTDWYPDLVLHSGPAMEDLVWIELKQLNLLRHFDETTSNQRELLEKKLGNQLRQRWTAFRKSFEYARAIQIEETGKSFADKELPLQNFTLIPALRGPNARLCLRDMNHWAAAFMLAVVPSDLAFRESFEAERDRVIEALVGASFFKEDLRSFGGSSYGVTLVGAVVNVAARTLACASS